MEPLGGWKRTHTCGELNRSHVNQRVTLMGWVHRRRDHGGLIFIDLRDRYGITQIIFDSQVDSNAYERARQLRNEFVVAINGYVRPRPADMINPNRSTGEVEIETHEIKILNEAITTPFPIVDQVDASEENRLKYRYLDLRRPEMQTNLLLRHKLYQLARNYFTSYNFIEIETPYLMKSTPEGARDYLVPSRNYKGRFYALPQSPQTYKQLLMVAGFDRYFQIVRCFRDEDLRSDRQPEFTQIDIEMSFIEPEDIFAIMEGFMKQIFQEFFQENLQMPIPRLTFAEAQQRFGSDKPDLRFGMEIATVTELVKNVEFKVFRQAIENQQIVCGICLKNGATYSRKRMDELNSYVLEAGGKGLVQVKVSENGWESSLTKFFTPTDIAALNQKMQASPGDLLLFIADEAEKAYTLMGNLRLKLAREENLIEKNKHQLLWIVDFPLLEFSPEENRHVARHHPFTSPMDADIPLLTEKPAEVRAKAYDLVLDGYEVAGGSIRIHSRDLQKQIFQILQISPEEAEQKFGFLMDAFQYGAPPHGGIAFGFDRLAMLLAGRTSLRDVIAFPKTTSALSLMDNAPTSVSPVQLKELGLILENSETDQE